MSDFFRTIVVDATGPGSETDAIRRMRREEFEGIFVRGVYSAEECALLRQRLEAADHALPRTSFPAPFRSHFLGMNLNLTAPDLSGYFDTEPMFREQLGGLFAGMTDLETRITGLLSTLDAGRRYRPAPGPSPGQRHMFTTLRQHLPGGFIPQHFDNEQETRESYREIMPQVVSDIFSFVLAFTRAEAGGALEVFNLRHGGRRFRMVDGAENASHLSVEGVESVAFRLAPGEMILFNSGRYLHRVTPVIGGTTRWTACSFMADGRDRDVLCWG
jgi:hypothetical protein